MESIDILGHYLEAARTDSVVCFGDEERTDQGTVESVEADSDGQADYLKITLKVPVPHESGSRE